MDPTPEPEPEPFRVDSHTPPPEYQPAPEPMPPAVTEPVSHRADPIESRDEPIADMAAPVEPPREPRASAPVFGGLAAMQAPKRRSGLMIGGSMAAVALIVVGALAALRWTHKGGTAAPAPPPPAAPAPTAAAPVAPPRADTAHADSAQVGVVRVIGDLPEDAIIWLDSNQQRGHIFTAKAGSYNLEVETGDFQPWEKQVTVRAHDTTRVRVELELKADSTSKPDSSQTR